MQPAHRFLSAVALVLLSASSFASSVTYTSSAAFLSRVLPGAYTEDFDALTVLDSDPLAFASNGFAYVVTAGGGQGLFEGINGHLETSQVDEALTITFTSGNVMAVGGNFFAVDIDDDFQEVLITLTLGDGTTTKFTPTSIAESYQGFVSDLAITSLVISGPGPSLYAALDNLTVGTVPEPTSWALAGLGLAGLLVTRRRSA